MLKIIVIMTSIFLANISLEAQENTFPILPHQTLNKVKAKIVYTRMDGSEYEKIKGENTWIEKSYSADKPNPILHLFSKKEKKTEIVYTRLDGNTYTTNNVIDWYDVASSDITINAKQAKNQLSTSNQYNVKIIPNPVKGKFDIQFQLNELQEVNIRIATLDGFVIDEISDGFLEKGVQSISVNSNQFYNGKYLLFVKIGTVVQSLNITISN